MAIDITQFYKVFFEESREHLDKLEQMLLSLNIEQPDLEQLDAIFRAAHSIKGGAATFGFEDITAITHILESLLDRLRKQQMPLDKSMVDVFLQTTDVIKEQINGHSQNKPANPTLAESVSNQLFALALQGAPLEVSNPKNTDQDDGFGFFDDIPSAKQTEDDGFGLFEPMDKDQSQKSKAQKVPKERKSQPEIESKRSGERRAGDRRAFVDRRAPLPAETSSIRVDIEKVDQLINLVGELVITEAMLSQGLSNAPEHILNALGTSLSQLERNTRALQEAILSIRMMPIGTLFSRFPRVVHDLSSKLNKQVDLQMIGEETELDKSLIEKIADPLTHLIRNSLDHGIESPSERKEKGKPSSGIIILSAMHQGGNIIIEIADDGAGLNSQRILKKAKELGLKLPDTINDEALWDIISQPGFSTAKEVTDVSGRGVGMDVVNRNIAELGGQISVMSTEGKGCTFTIRLPLTLAIVDGMIVSLGESLFVIPLNAIVETLQPKADDLKRVTGEGLMVYTREEYLPIITMHQAFNTPSRFADPTQGMLVIVESHGKKAALFLDDLVGQQQVVIKSLETNFRKINGISGATILGDGTVALIIDVSSIIKIGQATSGFSKSKTHIQSLIQEPTNQETLGEQHGGH